MALYIYSNQNGYLIINDSKIYKKKKVSKLSIYLCYISYFHPYNNKYRSFDEKSKVKKKKTNYIYKK